MIDALAVAACFFSLASAYAYGPFNERDYYPYPEGNLGPNGQFSYWECWGAADLENLTLPLNVNFSSARQSNSPYLGHGWQMPLFESFAVPSGQNSWKVVMPDGMECEFEKIRGEERIFRWGHWKGRETNNGGFEVLYPNGWNLRWSRGRIQEAKSPDGRTLSWVWNGDWVQEIRNGTQTVARIDRDETKGLKSIYLLDKKFEIQRGRMPQIQETAGTRLIGGFEESLSRVLKPDGKERTYSFEPDPATLYPKLQVTDESGKPWTFEWDPTTKQLLRDSDWTFELEKSEEGYVVGVRRVGKDGRSEYRCSRQGKTITEKNGIRRVVERFHGGPATGSVRRITETDLKTGKAQILFEGRYDEKGNLIWEKRADGEGRFLTEKKP